ncbi:MAG: RNase H family protein [Lachnospiraceae bacterium]
MGNLITRIEHLNKGIMILGSDKHSREYKCTTYRDVYNCLRNAIASRDMLVAQNRQYQKLYAVSVGLKQYKEYDLQGLNFDIIDQVLLANEALKAQVRPAKAERVEEEKPEKKEKKSKKKKKSSETQNGFSKVAIAYIDGSYRQDGTCVSGCLIQEITADTSLIHRVVHSTVFEKEVSGANISEIGAAIACMQWAMSYKVDCLKIHYDCALVASVLQGISTKEHESEHLDRVIEAYKDTYKLAQKSIHITLHKVKGHADNPIHNAVDRMVVSTAS